jgi:hypothetical protein
MKRFTPFPARDHRYGSPMGRRSTRRDFTGVTAFCVSAPQGEYDSGGAYWGTSNEGSVYAVWERGKSRKGVAYVRAKSKAGAISAVQCE